MFNPISTYRIQLHKDFNFDKLETIIPYLAMLGIGTVYASPVFKAVTGSMHGYDGTDPNEINPEIGTLDQLKKISDQLKDADINWLQDIVPNHMAFHQDNSWLMDVLQKSADSKYAHFFDLNPNEKLMVPFLGNTLDECIANKELKIISKDNKSYIQYYDNIYPLNTSTQIKDEPSGEELKEILDQQHYRLCSWKETDHRINYRRFFTINSLICLNIHQPGVFEEYHQLVKKLLEENVIQGLRIDHIDGLFNPTGYLHQLKAFAGKETYITTEKILQPIESLPAKWPVQHTTGYDFLGLVNNLLTQKQSKQLFTEFYQQLTNDFRSIETLIHEKKSFILFNHMQGELNNLCQLFKDSGLVDKRLFSTVRNEELQQAIAEFLICCPLYRFYGEKMPLDNEEAGKIKEIFENINAQNPDLKNAVTLLEQALIVNPHHSDDDRNKKAIYFYQRCMQFTGPLMAKGVEDTLMYTYNRLISHNEVGDQPFSFGTSIDAFHNEMIKRQEQFPYTQNTTSTHDTKRGEDARARLNVLSNISDLWFEKVKEWQQLNTDIRGALDTNDEYFIYQSLAGHYPFPGEDDTDFAPRFTEYLQKAFREAKQHSNWNDPDVEYESTAQKFAELLLQKETPFWKSFSDFHQQVIDHGIINSLTQLILKFTCPGIPDVYQGGELWNFSFVDPDNRRLVDYEKRTEWLKGINHISTDSSIFPILWEDRYSGKIKLWLTHQLFQLRRTDPELFTQGEYIPVEIKGAYKDHIIAFARKFRKQVYLIATPIHTAEICNTDNILSFDWKDTKIILPPGVNTEWDNLVTQRAEKATGEIYVSEAFKDQPFAIWKGTTTTKERSAGILLHISSLPSAFGIGDMGTEAKAFADFLYRSKQKYWQLLPLNPVDNGQGYSPYSSTSAMAGNPLFISPENLREEGLLDDMELSKYQVANESRINFSEIEILKEELLNKAFWSFLKSDDRHEYEAFCEKEKYWLNDFALFILLKQQQESKPWFQWPDEYKHRDASALQRLKDDNNDELYRIKWLQYIFDKQWKELKAYCNERNISIIGDMPFYISYDSADVWSDPGIFSIDENGNATGIAGVPPDAFSSDGQLWGMPVFKWDVLKGRNYDWWIHRVKRNREFFDIIRIDHFRAFSSYWEVPSDETTAKNGNWKPGPGSDFFHKLKEEIGELPFIAEDLGDVDDTVFQLRDAFALPGMKVLQFAFGNGLPQSVHIPHNYSENFIVYTGTHDNNTTRGWFKEADEETRQSLNKYCDKDINEQEVHWVLTRMAYASVAKIAIVPIQDLLNLDESARMNTPASTQNNWTWRLISNQLTKETEEKLLNLTLLYNRQI